MTRDDATTASASGVGAPAGLTVAREPIDEPEVHFRYSQCKEWAVEAVEWEECNKAVCPNQCINNRWECINEVFRHRDS